MDYYSTDIKKIKSNLLLNIADIYCVDIKDKTKKLKHKIQEQDHLIIANHLSYISW